MTATAPHTSKAPAISRRRIVQAAAWAAPAIVLATSAPAAASSGETGATCSTADNGTLATLTATAWAVASGELRQEVGGTTQSGWTPSTDGDLNNWNLGGGTGTSGAAGFQSMSDNTQDDAWTVVTVGYTFEAVANTTYQIEFTARTQHGFHNAARSARQSVVLSAIDTSGTTDLVKVSVDHDGAALPSNNRTDQDMRDLGYEMQLASPQQTEGEASSDDFTTYTAYYNAMNSGTVTLQYTFTLEAVYALGTTLDSNWQVSGTARQVSDDIWVQKPQVMQSGCF